MENVIVIGGGPAGMAASIYLARANLKPLVIAGSPPGGQLTLTSEVENYPGFESILGPELIEKYRNHAKKFGVRFIDQNVIKVDFTKKPFEVFTGTMSAPPVRAKAVIIATGAKALWLGLESEQRLRGKGVSACATCDGFFFKNKIVGVVGGGDTALEEALTLTNFAAKVYVFHRRDSFRASQIMQDRILKNPKIEVVWNVSIEEVTGEQRVEGIRLKSTKNGQKTAKEMKLDGLFIAIGHKPDTDLFKGQIELDEKGYIVTFERLAKDYLAGKINVADEKLKLIRSDVKLFANHTSVRGVFAAGDCVDHIYRQAATAIGQGVAAALDTERWLVEAM